MRGDWHGLPGVWRDDPTAVDGKRFIATLWSWHKIKQGLAEACKCFCESCGRFDKNADGHHVYGRGGGKRDDRPVVWYEGSMICMILYLCRECHGKAVIKPWGSWRWDEPQTLTGSCASGSTEPNEITDTRLLN
jgi:hypothetical protein